MAKNQGGAGIIQGFKKAGFKLGSFLMRNTSQKAKKTGKTGFIWAGLLSILYTFTHDYSQGHRGHRKAQDRRGASGAAVHPAQPGRPPGRPGSHQTGARVRQGRPPGIWGYGKRGAYAGRGNFFPPTRKNTVKGDFIAQTGREAPPLYKLHERPRARPGVTAKNSARKGLRGCVYSPRMAGQITRTAQEATRRAQRLPGGCGAAVPPAW